MTYTETQLSAIDIFGKYIPPISEDQDGTKDIPHLEDLFRVAEEKDWIMFVDEKSLVIRKWKDKSSNDTISYSPILPLLDQPNLSEIVNLFSK